MPIVLVSLSVGVLAVAVLTALGARRRGAGVPLAVLAGACFPVAWAVWYLRDEHPYHRAAS